MPRPFRPMVAYPTTGPWQMTTIRVPVWLRDEINHRAVVQQAEPWVSLMDLMTRTQQLPPSRIPEWPQAVIRRYGLDLSDDGMLSTGQLELGALAARASHPEDAEAEADEAAGRPPRRTSRPREKETAAGGIAAVVRRADQRARGQR
jgi:hypothetical protein